MISASKKINICSDPILKDILAGQGIEAEVFDDVLTREEKTKMLESLERFASNWFLAEGSVDYTEYRNVSIGAAIHDEVMTLFHHLIHFIFIIDKLESEKIIFYHSKSCLMPDTVIGFLEHFNITVKLVDEKYPWLSFKEQLDSQAKSNCSRISFGRYDQKYSYIRSRLGQIKLGLKQVISKFFGRVLKKSKRNIYFHSHRSLAHFYRSCLEKEKNNFGIYISDTTPLESGIDKRSLGILGDIRQLFRLAKKGIILDSLRCPFYYKWYLNYKKKSAYKKLVDNNLREFPGKAAGYFELKNKSFLEYFEQTYSKLYLDNIIQFIKLIDFYYKKFTSINVDLCLQELCHAFQAQVLANIGIPCRFYPSNYIIHNQYFAPFFFKKVKHFIKPLTFSCLDAQRFQGLGFSKENIQTLDPSFFKYWDGKMESFHKIDSIKEKKILILAPSIISMDAFRYQLQSKKLYSFFSDVFTILSELQVTSVTIRPHPGADLPQNQFGYTDNDILKYLVDKVDDKKKSFKIIFSGSFYHNLEKDILDNDIIIGNLSGAIFEVLIFGRDYIYFDDTITPHYGTKDWSLFNEGTIKKLRTREELRDYLINYKPLDLDLLREKLFGDKLEQGGDSEALDPFILL